MKHYPQCDWTFLERIVSKYSSKHPRSTFKILGYVILAFTRWADVYRIRKFKRKNPCEHSITFCACGLNYLKENPRTNRPILTNMELTTERQKERIIKVNMAGYNCVTLEGQPQTLSKDPMSLIQVDEMGPIFIGNVTE